MVEQPFVDTDLDQNLPVFDNGYLLRYITDDDTTAMLEVFEKEGRKSVASRNPNHISKKTIHF